MAFATNLSRKRKRAAPNEGLPPSRRETEQVGVASSIQALIKYVSDGENGPCPEPNSILLDACAGESAAYFAPATAHSVLPNVNRVWHPLNRSRSRHVLDVAGCLHPELLKPEGAPEGRLTLTAFANHLRRYHREAARLWKNRKARLLAGTQAQVTSYGCGKCRWAPKGCSRCRAPGFQPGKREGRCGGIPKPASERELVCVGKPGDGGGVRCSVAVTDGSRICTNLERAGLPPGYGVVALAPIKQGEPVLEYVGELLEADQAEARENWYAKSSSLSSSSSSSSSSSCLLPSPSLCYQLRVSSGLTAKVIDSTLYGNIGRFINSSCKPNMEARRFRVNKSTAREGFDALPRVMFHATRDIEAGEELTWRYNLPDSAERDSKAKAADDAKRRRSRRSRGSTGKSSSLSTTTPTQSLGIGPGDSMGIRCLCGAPGCCGVLE